MTLVSACIRYIAVYLPTHHYASYLVLLFGTAFAAIAQPLLMNASPQVAGNWFKETERDLVTTIAVMFSPLGNALGKVGTISSSSSSFQYRLLTSTLLPPLLLPLLLMLPAPIGVMHFLINSSRHGPTPHSCRLR